MGSILHQVFDLKNGHERFFGGTATTVRMSKHLVKTLEKEIEPLLNIKSDPPGDGKTRVFGLVVEEVESLPGVSTIEVY